MNDTERNAAWLDWLLAVGLFVLALWLRTSDLTHFVTADEHNWVYRSGLFTAALLQQDWPATETWLTPGVTTTWLGAASLLFYYQRYVDEISRPLTDWLLSFPRNKIDLSVLLVLRWSVAIFSAIMVAIVYGLGRKLWVRSVALLGALLLLTEPHLLAVSRIIGHDVLVTFLMAASLLALLHGRNQIRRNSPSAGWFILSGMMAGLAVLSKAVALFLIPFAGLLIFADLQQPGRRWPSRFRLLFLWGIVMWGTFIAGWPAAWVDPLGQTWDVVNNAFLSSAGLEDADIQPFWAVPDLGAWYYLVNGAFKVSPFLMVGPMLALLSVWIKKQPWPRDVPWLAIFAILFTIFMTFGVKKSPRYILPAFPALVFVAAWGWLVFLNNIGRALAAVAIGGLAVAFSLQYAPYYFTYLNPLIGGSNTGPNLVRVGWGEGLDELGRWLNTQPDVHASHLGVRYTATIFPYFQGDISSPVSDELDYVGFYIKQSQSGYPAPEILAYFEGKPVLHTVTLDGVDYAQVYDGPGMIRTAETGRPNWPIAFRPHTIYAPIGDRLTLDVLWPSETAIREPVTITMRDASGAWLAVSGSSILETSPGAMVSTHQFDIPVDLPRAEYDLVLDNTTMGHIKARHMILPADFTDLDEVINQQIKLAGIKETRQPDILSVDLAWQAWPRATNDYTVFVQLLDANGERAAGIDVAPERGFTQLDRKEIQVMHYDIALPETVPAGLYTMLIGLYYFAGDELINVGSVTLPEPLIIE